MAFAPTMDDVARAAGCSRSTVSLALRGVRTIPEDTRARVLKAAERVGYRTNPLVAALMSFQRSRRTVPAATTIAYLTHRTPGAPWRTVPDFCDLHDGAAARAAELGCLLEEFQLGSDRLTPERLRGILRARCIHALLAAPLPGNETTLDLDVSDLAVVGLGPSVRSPCIERVANDHFQSAALAVDRCLALGYRRIGLVVNREVSERMEGRWRGGYTYMLEHRGAECRPPVLLTEGADTFAGRVRGWLAAHRPDVVLKSNVGPQLASLLPARIGLASLSVNDPRGADTGVYQDLKYIGRLGLDYVVAKLHANSFGPHRGAPLHVTPGVWVPGRTAPGPGRLRFIQRR